MTVSQVSSWIGWNLALAIFGLHLLVLGYLVVRSNYIPSVLGVLVAIAALGYLIDSFGGLLSNELRRQRRRLHLRPGRCCSWPGCCGAVGGCGRSVQRPEVLHRARHCWIGMLTWSTPRSARTVMSAPRLPQLFLLDTTASKKTSSSLTL